MEGLGVMETGGLCVKRSGELKGKANTQLIVAVHLKGSANGKLSLS